MRGFDGTLSVEVMPLVQLDDETAVEPDDDIAPLEIDLSAGVQVASKRYRATPAGKPFATGRCGNRQGCLPCVAGKMSVTVRHYRMVMPSIGIPLFSEERAKSGSGRSTQTSERTHLERISRRLSTFVPGDC